MPVDSSYPVPGWWASAPCHATTAQPDGSPLWLTRATVRAGCTIEPRDRVGEEAVYVLSGELKVGKHSCPPGSALLLEAHAQPVLEVSQDTELIHVGSRLPAGQGGSVHLVGPRGWFHSGEREKVDATWFADGTCPTCRIAFFSVARPPAPERPGPVHTHSQDEIIHVLEGQVRLGARRFGAGTSLCIPAEVRYALTIGDVGAKFLNYRPLPSHQTYFERGGDTRVEEEGGLARGGVEVRDLITLPG